MNTKINNSASSSNAKETDKLKKVNYAPSTPQLSHKIKDLSKIVVMSGTATRKPLPNLEINKRNCSEETNLKFDSKNNFRQDIQKLRTPYNKPRLNQAHTEEKFMHKSCEILFDCIKPYKDILKNTKLQVSESSQRLQKPFHSGIIYQMTATRKVQFLSICKEVSTPSIFDGHKFFFDSVSSEESEVSIKHTETEHEKSYTQGAHKTISSEDFIKNAFMG